MTGHSWNKAYIKKMISCLLVLSGSFLLLEHIYNYGGVDLEIIGHEFWGICLIGAGILLCVKWKQLPALMRAITARDLKAILDEGEREKYK